MVKLAMTLSFSNQFYYKSLQTNIKKNVIDITTKNIIKKKKSLIDSFVYYLKVDTSIYKIKIVKFYNTLNDWYLIYYIIIENSTASTP